MIKFEFGLPVFVEGGMTGEPGEKPSQEGENQQQIQPTYGNGPESNLGPIGKISPLRHSCFWTNITLAKKDMSLRRRQSLILKSDSYF